MRYLLFIIYLSISRLLFSQSSTQFGAKDYVYLYNDSTFTSEHLEFHTNLFKIGYISIDNRQFNLKEVKFYKEHKWLHANIRKTFFLRTNSFVECKDTGNVNVYFANPNYRSYKNTIPSELMKIGYYNKGFEDLKPIRLKHMKVDLSDNDMSLKYIKQTRQLDFLTGSLFVSGFTLFGVGFLESYGNPGLSPLLYLSGGLILSAYIPMLLRRIKIRKAFEVYNIN